MALTNFPYGVTSFGVVLSGFGASLPSGGLATGAPGQTVFVDAVNGTSGMDGLTPQTAVKTVTQALAILNKLPGAASGLAGGDTIFVFPGSYSDNMVINRDYVSIIGCTFAGYGRPDFEATTGVTLTIQAQGFRAQHCRFAGTADVVVQNGNGFMYDDCVFDGDGNGATTALFRFLPALLRASTTHFTASEGVIQNSLFRGSGGFAIAFDTAAAPVGVGSTDNVIRGNLFRANTGVDIVTRDTGTGTYSVQLVTISENKFEDKNKATYLDFTTTNGGAASDQSGTVAGNYFSSDTMTTTVIKAVGTAFTFPGNYDNVGIFDGSGLD
jgi:hypothetical protein